MHYTGSIDVNLIVWSQQTTLPFGAPGDPASDYTTGGLLAAFNGGCGVRQKNASQPYKGSCRLLYLLGPVLSRLVFGAKPHWLFCYVLCIQTMRSAASKPIITSTWYLN